MKPTIDAILEKCAFSEQKVWRDCGYDDESEPGVKQIIGGGKAVHSDLMPIIRELCSEIERLRKQLALCKVQRDGLLSASRYLQMDGNAERRSQLNAELEAIE